MASMPPDIAMQAFPLIAESAVGWKPGFRASCAGLGAAEQTKNYSTENARRYTQMDRAERSAGGMTHRTVFGRISHMTRSICVYLRASAVEFSGYSLLLTFVSNANAA
jgi:hypothetical protein